MAVSNATAQTLALPAARWSSMSSHTAMSTSMKGLAQAPIRMVAVAPARCSVHVHASKRAEELKEIREMSTEAIEKAVVDLKGELFLLRAKRATRLEFKPSDFGKIHKKIARLLTVRRERELESGIDKRESRKMDRAWKKSVVPAPPPSYKPEEWKK